MLARMKTEPGTKDVYSPLSNPSPVEVASPALASAASCKQDWRALLHARPKLMFVA